MTFLPTKPFEITNIQTYVVALISSSFFNYNELTMHIDLPGYVERNLNAKSFVENLCKTYFEITGRLLFINIILR
jgi:hypothetical protein